jgi:hypothetical protein
MRIGMLINPEATEATKSSNHEFFAKMAAKIKDNENNGFAGAFVIVPPEGAAQDMLMLDSSANPSIFWSTLKVRVEIALAELDAEQRQGGMGGFRR